MEKIQAASLYGEFGKESSFSLQNARPINPKTGLAYSRKERRKLQRSLLKQHKNYSENEYKQSLTERESAIIFGEDE